MRCGNSKQTLRSRVAVIGAAGKWTFDDRVRDALILLWQASDYAHELQHSPWDFAVEKRCLLEAGLTENDLRWMTLRGLVEHRVETTTADCPTRTFESLNSGLKLRKRSCFVLSSEGIPRVQRFLGTPRRTQIRWDSVRHCLFVEGEVVKEFRLPSPNQERILSAFEEESWPIRIDDPLPPSEEIQPKRRLNDAIKGLNRNQKRPLIRFHGDGSGEGVTWKLHDAHR